MNSTVRPQDAAGLILVRRPVRGAAEVLLGRRHAATRFMPGYYVTPGGRLEGIDSRPSGFSEPLQPPEGDVDAATGRRLPALARCALRETAEETGLLVGRPAPLDRRPTPHWAPFIEAGLTPAFGDLRLIARAITPAGSPIRFHTRFFLVDGALAEGRLAGDGELEDLRWIPQDLLSTVRLAEVTRLVIAEALRQGEAPAPLRVLIWRRDGRTLRPSKTVEGSKSLRR